MARDPHGDRTEQYFSMKQIRIIGFYNKNSIKSNYNVFIQPSSVSSAAAILETAERPEEKKKKKK